MPAATTPVDPALAAAVEAAARLPGVDIAGVLLADEAGETAAMHACAGGWTVHSLNLRVSRGHGLAGRILETRRPWKVDDYTCDRSIRAEDFASMLADDGTRAGLGAPMLAGDQLVGVLMVWSRRIGAFDVGSTQALVTLADLAALAVLAHRREQAARREAAMLSARADALAGRLASAERGAAFRDELAGLLLAGGETAALLSAVCAHTGGDAALFDHGLGELAACGAAGPIRDRVARQVRRTDAAAEVVLPPLAGFPRWTLLRAVAADGLALGRLALVLPHPPTRPTARAPRTPRSRARCTSSASGRSWTPARGCTATSSGSCWRGWSTTPWRRCAPGSSAACCRGGCGWSRSRWPRPPAAGPRRRTTRTTPSDAGSTSSS